jgi:hypothetical protein
MKDAEINLAIAKIEYPNDSWRMTHGDGVARVAGQDLIVKDYCNNWQDIGPIIEREKIDLVTSGQHEWLAMRGEQARAGTPTKAAALCYLKMKESE